MSFGSDMARGAAAKDVLRILAFCLLCIALGFGLAELFDRFF